MKRKINEKDVCKTTRSERRKKLQKFKEVARRCFGPAVINGIGKGKPLICAMCGQRVYRATTIIYKYSLVTVCSDCSFDSNKLNII